MIPIAKIVFSKEEEESVLRVMRSGYIAQGPEVASFEKEFAAYLGCRYAAAVSSGTVALYLALLSLNLNPKDEVITTPFSFVASSSTILMVGAKPVFADIGNDFNLDVGLVEKKINIRTKAILPVHLFGNPCDMGPLLKLARKHHLAIIEDACQAHGAEYHGQKVGSFGKMGCFSFYATKNMTTGEGGMITTNQRSVYDFLIKTRSHGTLRPYYHNFLGYNFRMTEMQATLGREQLKKLDHLNEGRRRNAFYLNQKLKGIPGLILPVISPDKKSVFHQYTVRVTKKFAVSRLSLMRLLSKKGIDFGVYYPRPIHRQKLFLKLGYQEKYPRAEKMVREVLSLPIHPQLRKRDLDYIITSIKNIGFRKTNG